jgi:folate-binding protein YgfZ
MTTPDGRAQLEAARRSVLAVEQPERATLVVTGKDRVSWLNGLVTCDLVKVAADHAPYGLLTAKNGRILGDTTVVLAPERAVLVVPRPRAESLRAHLEHYLVMEDAEIARGDDAFAVLDLHGPRSGDVLAAARLAGALGGTVDRTGLGGAIVLLPANDEAHVRAAVERATAEAGGVVGTSQGWESLRLERGIPRFGVDFDDTTYPQEASIEKVAVSFDKGCYLGQEVVCMLELRGKVKRRLVPVVLEAGTAPAAGAQATDEAGAPAGEVTSAAMSPTLGKPVALAMLRRAVAEPGTRVALGGALGQVVDRPA